MKFVSWNVNGIRAAWEHGLSAFLDKNGADIYALQETRTDVEIPMMVPEGYKAYWSFCGKKKGYSGTLCLTKMEPLNVRYDIGNPSFDTEGRIITLEFEDFYFVNCYVPNSQRSDRRYDYRNTWDLMFIQYLINLRCQKPTIVCGDFNVPISDYDIYEENKWVELNSEGFQSTERESLLQIIECGFTDTYRMMHPDEKKYTWWSTRRYKRKENRGWRLDYFLVSDKLKENVKESNILSEVYGSDHCPIVLEINTESSEVDEETEESKSRLSYTYKDLLHLEERGVSLNQIKRTDMTNLWGSIDWERAEKHLETMQMALAKSAYTREPELIEKWQKKIVSSIDAKLLAVRHVCSNSGGTGVDCIKWESAHEKMSAALSLDSKGYKAMPARLLLVKSRNGKERRIHIETYFDRAMQCLYAFALDPIAESWGDRKSFSYRKGRSAFDVNEYIKLGLSGEDAPEWIFMGDVRKCYENISHDWIVQHIPMAPRVLWQFLEAGYVFAGHLFPMDVGVGIGCTISPIIANMTLDGMQDYVYEKLYPLGQEIDYADGNMIRYADDVIFMARSKERAEEIKGYVKEFLQERGLELSEDKSKIVNINDEFDFLSRTYFKRGDKAFSRPSEESIERFMSNLKDTIAGYSGSQKSLIEKINHKIDGWVSYHKVGEADKAFRKLDIYISALLLELCEEKHQKWSREKILNKYWFVDSEGRHRYALPNKKEVCVKCLSDTLLVDFVAVKTKVNPYIDLDYVEFRSKERQIANVTGIYRTIWNRQEGRCHYCGHRILRDEARDLVEIDASRVKLASRMAYVHKRCANGSFDYIDSVHTPASMTDIMKLLEKLDEGRKPLAQRLLPLSEFFRTCEKNSVTLTFKQIEEIIGEELGATSERKEFWYRTGLNNISQCWLDNGYEIRSLYLEGRQRVVFRLSSLSKNTASIEIPEVLKYGRVPNDAKYELENYFQYIIKKYGL